MTEWNGNCHRCGKRSIVYTMSRFNTDLICMVCEDAERKHPQYKKAVEAEEAAIRAGNLNFPGIGYPGKG